MSHVDAPSPRVVRVLPDVAAIDKEFDYLVPDGTEVAVGDVVRIDLHGRRVGGWIVEVDPEPEPAVALKPLAKVSGRGPARELIDLAGWAAWRWAGRRASLLRTASPSAVVRSVRAVPEPRASIDPGTPVPASGAGTAVDRVLALDRGVLRLGPGADRVPLVEVAADLARANGGQLLVLCPSVDEALGLAGRLRRSGWEVAVLADVAGVAGAREWARAGGGADVVVGARAAAWAPAPRLARVVVLDEHDEAYQQEQAPTWNARDVAIERARRAAVPCTVVSPCPTLESLGWGELVVDDRGRERGAWSRVEVVDQREIDPSLGPLFSPRLVELVRSDQQVLCILNRTGRARLLVCATCTTVANCEVCDSAVSSEVGDDGSDALRCTRCGASRPPVCLACGASRFKHLRLGVSRAREELEALVGEPVAEVTASANPAEQPSGARVQIGTEALLHRVPRAGSVAFLDMDQELLSPRYRAAEEALALVARAARLVARGGASDGRVLVQTRSPDHPALVAARHADPGRLVTSERHLRAALGLPPVTAMAIVSGEAAPAFTDGLRGRLGDAATSTPEVKVQGPSDGRWRVVAPDHASLCDLLGSVDRPPGRLRIEVDPLRA